ncbi:hypothetical protein, partial [Chryseobacterium sp. CH1]|uniref:hypothetical protein n=1 Tax=Chryseobacterium sp. CH1 TaxID=713551 RepID=UPI001626150C
KVTVYPSDNPVITTVDISGSTVTIYANGGTPPYQYSMDNINWQDSHIFTNIARGEAKVYVRDGK